jgi:hypothetical protein
MHPSSIANGDGAWTASIFSGMVSTPQLVVWPMVGAAARPTPEAAEQIYRLALEWAWAAVLSSPYERARQVSSN